MRPEPTGGFSRLTAPDLDQVAVVAQCLDNQWVPRSVLADMRAGGHSLEDVGDQRADLVRSEYLRSLLTARQVIVNRTFLYNNSAVARDYRRDESRQAFAGLLRTGAIVPYFFREESPYDLPAGVQVDDAGFNGWLTACRAAEEFSCLRLSWDDRTNLELTARVGLSFHEFATGAYGRTTQGGLAEFGRHLGLPEDQYDTLKSRLRHLRNWANSRLDAVDLPVTREQVYREFVTPDGDDPTRGRIDPRKPLSAELKQLVDLQYNTALPEFLDRLPLRPVDTLHRAALRESIPPRRTGAHVAAEELERTLRTRIQFDVLSESLTPFQAPSFLDLDLAAILRVRQTDEWATYMSHLSELIGARESAGFETHGENLIAAHGAVLRRLAEGRGRHSWLSRRVVTLEVAGTSLRVLHGSRPTFVRVGRIEGRTPRSMATVRFAVVNRLRSVEEQLTQPHLIVDTLRAPVDDPRELVERIVTGLQRDGFIEQAPVPTSARTRLGGVEKDVERNQ